MNSFYLARLVWHLRLVKAAVCLNSQPGEICALWLISVKITSAEDSSVRKHL